MSITSSALGNLLLQFNPRPLPLRLAGVPGNGGQPSRAAPPVSTGPPPPRRCSWWQWAAWRWWPSRAAPPAATGPPPAARRPGSPPSTTCCSDSTPALSLPVSQVFLVAVGGLEAAAKQGYTACCHGASAGCEKARLPTLGNLLRQHVLLKLRPSEALSF